ncbi:MAG: hypothetical protein Q9220_007556 [cf. Caloplaca sp. 1 TL-2023]
MRGLLVQACQSILKAQWPKAEDKDEYLGPVSVSAAFLKDSQLFSTVASQVTGRLELDYYAELGELVCFTDPVVSEHDIVNIITKCGKFHQVWENLDAFRNGFFRGNPHRSDKLEANNMKRWVDSLLHSCLCDSDQICEQDAKTLVNLILERKDAPFSQFLLYQGVRTFIKSHQKTALLTTPLMVQLLSSGGSRQDRSENYLDTLRRNIMEPMASNFNVSQYAAYIDSCKPKNQYQPSGRRHKQEKNQNSLTTEQSNKFLISFIEELIPAIEVSFTEAQSCIRSLIILYTTRTVSQEPKKPVDWTREEDTGSCSLGCDKCSKMNIFLRDPHLKDFDIPNPDYHLSRYFNHFEYFDEKKDSGYNTVRVSKTLKWWEKWHTKWQERADAAITAMTNLPQDRLKECLRDEFEAITDLRTLRAEDDAVMTEGESQPGPDLGSTVPQKRAREDED